MLTNKDCLENNETGEITKGDVFGIIDYLYDGLSDYIENFDLLSLNYGLKSDKKS